MVKRKGNVQVTAVSWTSYADKVPLRWAPPLLDRMQVQSAAEFQWRRLQVAFPDLPDPATVPEMPTRAFTPEQMEAIDRYLALAQELAQATVFGSEEGFTVYVDDDGKGETVEAVNSARDITAGFLVTWRQFYATDEDASFDRVRGYLLGAAKDTPAFEPIKAWSKAAGRLKGTHLEHLVLEGLAGRGDIPYAVASHSTHDRAKVDNPQMLISKQLYGDLVHWGDKRAELATAEDPFKVAWERLTAIEAATALGYVYIGFARVVASALGRSL